MEPEKKANGAVLGLVIIILILLFGGIYIWRSNMRNNESALDATASSLKSGPEASYLG